jgi:hypothetical protein
MNGTCTVKIANAERKNGVLRVPHRRASYRRGFFKTDLQGWRGFK